MYRPSGSYGHYREQSDEFEQPLVEEFDPDFQPDEDEIRMYAVQKLGMELPQDQMLLYLAKEALKKPLPDTWGAYQRADGEVYYKHKVTQQKTTEHPIDVEYRRIYQQEKDKVARRTLKSKTSKPAGLAAMKLLGNIAREDELNLGNYGGSAFGNSSSGQQSYLNQPIGSNISGISEPDQFQMNRQFEENLKKYQQSLLKDLQQFRFKEQKQFTERERRLRDSHQEELDRISRNSMLPISFEERLKQQKNSLRKQIEEEQESNFKRELRDEEQRLKREVIRTEKDLETEWNLKMKDIEERNNQKIQAKSALLQRIKEDLELEKQQREQQRVTEALRAKQEFQRKRQEFNQQADRHLNMEIQKISRDRAQKVRQRKDELEAEYNRIRKMLKSTPQDKIKQLIERKTRLQQISVKKYDIHRMKELQVIERNAKTALEEEKYRLRERLEVHYHQLENGFIQKQQTKLKQHVDDYSKESVDRLRKKEKQIFDRFKQKLSQYQLNKNNRLISARQNFITEIESQKEQMEKEHGVQSIRLQVREKEFDVNNREKMLKGLRDDVKFNERKLKKYELDRKLYRAQTEDDIIEALKNYLSNLKQQSASHQQNSSANKVINSPMKTQQKDPLPAVFTQHQRRLDEFKKTLASDKDILARVLSHLQSTSMLPFYDRQKIMKSDLPSDVQLTKLQSIGTAKNDLVKKYNSDVRKIRQNEKVLAQFESILKKAEYDEQNALMQLRQFQLDYKVPQLRAQLQASSSQIATHIDRMKQTKSGIPAPSNPFHTDMLTTKKVQDLFDDHSRFLMNVKQQLNNKLWQIRGMNHYSNLYHTTSHRF